jgi:hypothetical protein
MTSTELENLIRAKLQEASLLRVVDEFKSQFLEFPDGFFVELVLTDGGKLVDVERIGREVREALRKQNIDLDVIVRSIWTVKDVGDPRDVGGASDLLAVPVTLISGAATQEIEVDVGPDVVEEVKSKIARTGWSRSVAIRDAVSKFVQFQLTLGGESYWDPIRDNKQMLSMNAYTHLFMPYPVRDARGS